MDSQFLDYEGLEQVIKNIKTLINTSAPILSSIPARTIVAWDGTEDEIPIGWRLCNGEDGTPDLRDKFILSSGERYSIGDTGGSDTANLRKDSNAGGSLFSAGDEEIVDQIDILPPYYVLCFIMKLDDKGEEGINITPEMIGAASAENPVLTGSISMGRLEGSVVGEYSSAFGERTIASGTNSHAEGYYTTASGNSSHAEGSETTASGNSSHAEGHKTTASGPYSHAEGNNTTASLSASHAEGDSTKAIGSKSHAEGSGTTASGECSHAEGTGTTSSGNYSHAEGYNSIASGSYSYAGGYAANASASHAYARGRSVFAEYERSIAVGSYNVLYTPTSTTASDRYYFVVGKGTGDAARANAFRVTADAAYGVTSWKSSGADYAEMFEWWDANPNNEDRAGLFVTLEGDRIRIANPDDDYILGIVSAAPSVCGDVYDDQWSGMFETDIFGRFIWEDVEIPADIAEDGTVIEPAHIEPQQKVNSNYDHTQKYIPRSKRPEWDAVGLIGKLIAIDDYSCIPNGYCKVGPNGIATHSDEVTKYRVLKRIDASHIQIMIL